MASVNKVILVGNLGRDPETRYGPDNMAICNLSIATSFVRKDRNTGERIEEAEWHRVVLFGRTAEVASEYLRKGSAAYIEGRLRTRKWQDKETGQDRYSTEIVADQMQMLGGRDDAGAQGGDYAPQQQRPQAPQRPAAPRQQPAQNQYAQQSGGSMADLDSDIPFMRLGHGAAWRCI